MHARIVIALTAGLVWIGVPLGRAADDPSPEPPADVVCRLDSGTGTLTPSGGPKGTWVRITGAGYTGNATLTFKSVPPARLKFRFAGIRGMQTFTLADGKHTYQGHLGGAGKAVAHWDKNGRTVGNAALAAVTMVIELTRAGDIDVSVSTRGVEAGKELKINWVQYLVEKRGRGK